MGERLRVGLVGAGAMGAWHARSLYRGVPTATLAALYDPSGENAASVAALTGAKVANSVDDLLLGVDAVIVASPDSTHTALVLACLDRQLPVLCEKPLGTDAVDAERVVVAEVAIGHRLVQMGFNRRFDLGYRRLRTSLTGGSLGMPLLAHAVHRNPFNASSTDDRTLITGSMIHEFDMYRWLLADEIVTVRVQSPVTNGFRDPQLAVMRTARGALLTAEVFVNARYGYDVRTEIVGSEGAAHLDRQSSVVTRVAGERRQQLDNTSTQHFAESYDRQLLAWTHAATHCSAVGASAWDGYMANLVANSAIRSLSSGRDESVVIPPTPGLYA